LGNAAVPTAKGNGNAGDSRVSKDVMVSTCNDIVSMDEKGRDDPRKSWCLVDSHSIFAVEELTKVLRKINF